MDSFKKEQLKKKIKEKKKWLIGTGIFLVCGIIAWVIGSFLSGENPIKWLTSPFAITIYVLVGLFLVFCGIALFAYFMNKESK